MTTTPNLFLIGHPRSGTGTITGLLEHHPDIFMGAKELHYFGQDLRFNTPPRSWENYLSYYRNSENHLYRGDPSTWYLSSQTAAAEIHRHCPQARILLSLRFPADWLYSLHSHQVFAGYEDICDFQAALDAEEQRLQGHGLPDNLFPQNGVFYRSLVRYVDQIERWSSLFGDEQVHVVIFDEMKQDKSGTLDNVLKFLGLTTVFEGREEALAGNKKSRNANHAHRSGRLHRWIKSPPRRGILFGSQPPPFPGSRLFLRAARRLNTTDRPRPPILPELNKQLQLEFVSELEQLEARLGRKIQAWRRG